MSMTPLPSIQSYEIELTQPGEVSFDEFLALPGNIFPYYKRQIEQKNQYHPDFFHQGILLKLGSETVGRIGIYHNPGLRMKGEPAVCLGNYECIADEKASEHLFQAAKQAVREMGISYLIGPMNGSIWNDHGLLTGEVNPNFFLEPYYPAYYQQQFLAAGFEEIATYVSALDRDISAEPEEIVAREAEFLAEGVRFRSINPQKYPSEMRRLYAFAMKSLAIMPFFSPVSWEVFKDLFSNLQPWVEPELVMLAESADGELIGCFFCIQDFLNTEELVLIARSVARSPEPRWQGLGEVLMMRMYRKARQKGFQAFIHAFMPASFGITQLSHRHAGEAHKTYSLYGMRV